ncbi:MAG: hypothetical protein Q4A27_00420 [bacterium]|nr:hypothetical protein [bacterium]
MNTSPLNQDNIISAVARVALKTRKSERTGNNYTMLTIRFKNGLEIDYLVDKKDLFGLTDAVNKISQSENKQKTNKIFFALP